MALPRSLLITTTVPETMATFVLPQLPALSAAGWRIHLVTAPGPWDRKPTTEGVVCHEVPMRRAMSPVADAVALERWVKLIREVTPDVVVGSTPKAGLLSMAAARICHVPNRIYQHRGARWETLSGFRRSLLLRADRATAANATEVLAVSPSLADLLVKQGVTETRPTVLGRGGAKGVELELFTPSANGRDSDAPPTLGFVGRITRDKGVATLLEIFDLVREHLPDSRLVIAGEADDSDPIDESLLGRIRNDSAIEWRGRILDVAPMLRELDVFVFPSLREGLPESIIEAAACGVPTVGWDVTGVRDAIDDGRTGRLAPVGNVPALANATLDVLSRGRASFQPDCRTWAAQFEQDLVTELFVEWLEEATRSNRR